MGIVFGPRDHLRHLGEFIRGVALAGGTTPHLIMTVESARNEPDRMDQLWWLGAYALAYNWPTAEQIWLQHPPARFTDEHFLAWSKRNWAGIALRKERKAVLRPEAFARCAGSYLEFAYWLDDQWDKALSFEGGAFRSYDAAFEEFTGRVWGMGRYIAIRWLEAFRRTFGADHLAMPDIRPHDSPHPRKALALIYPQAAAVLLGPEGADAARAADEYSRQCMEDLRGLGIETDFYELQSLLCEYKQSALGRKQYPGKSIDTEVSYFDKIMQHWGPEAAEDSWFWSVRERCFPAWSLGEKAGWRGVRKELGAVLAEHGYTWSDALYDYAATKDLAHPARRPDTADSLLPTEVNG